MEVVHAIIPILNLYVLFKIIMGSGWLFLTLLIPIIGQIMLFISLFNLTRHFNKGILYAIGCVLFTPIFICIIGFSDTTYYK